MNLPTSHRWRSPSLDAGGQNAAEKQGVGLDLRQGVALLWRYKWLASAVVLLAMIVGVFMARTSPQVFSATSTVMLNTRQMNVIETQSVLSALSADYAAISGEVHVITSQQLLSRVVDATSAERDAARALAAADGAAPDAGVGWVAQARAGILGVLDAGVDSVAGLVGMKVPEKQRPDAHLSESELTRVRRVENLRKALTVRQADEYAPVIDITVVSGRADRAVKMANAIAEQYISDQLEEKFLATQRATSWLSTRVADLKQQLEASEAAVAKFREQLSAGLGQGIELTQRQMAELSSQLVDARGQRAAAEAQLERVFGSQEIDQQDAAAREGETLSLAELERQRSDLLAREREAATQFGAGDSRTLALRQQVADLDREISSRMRSSTRNVRLLREIEALRADVELKRARENALEQSLKELEQRSNRQSTDAIELNNLEREAEANQLIYENFLARLKETSELSGFHEADARVLKWAEVATFAGKSARSVVFRAGLVGLGLTIALIYLLEHLNNKFRAATELEEATGLPVLASIPRLGVFSRRDQLIEHIRTKPGSALSEAVRGLRTGLMLSNIDAPPRTVMFTSSTPSEGKSTTALMLAYLYVQMDRSAIVVDCDVRRPVLAKALNLKFKEDLLTVLDGSSTLDESIQIDPMTGVHILPIKRSVSQAADVLSSNRFAELVKELRSRYDLVVLDSPPILYVSDAGAIGQHADAVIYAVRWNQTPREATNQGMKRLQNLGVTISGTVLTMVDRRSESKYSSYKYGYRTYSGKYYSS